jgi:hypothetical protein
MYGDIHISVSEWSNYSINVLIFLAFKNGGGKNDSESLVYHICSVEIGAFLIPYFCVYFLIGTPLYFLELSLGQFTSRGATAAFKMSRLFKGS